jgi:hypothetical protein
MQSVRNFLQRSMPMMKINLQLLLRQVAIVLLCWPMPSFAQGAEEIRFRSGENRGSVSGMVTDTIKTWQFRARKDQQVTVTLTPVGGDKGMLTMTVYAYCGEEYGSPLNAGGVRWQGRLPCGDRYTIDVMPGAEAMRDKRAQRYMLTLDIR